MLKKMVLHDAFKRVTNEMFISAEITPGGIG